MATTLYLTSATSPLGGSGQYALSPSRGSSAVSAVTATVASGTSIPVTDTAGGTTLTWWYQVGAGTISGNMTANIRGKESSAAANAGAGVIVDLYQADGTTLIGNLMTTTVPTTITEYSTTDAAKVLASKALTARTATNGCWIKVTLTVRNKGTMGAGGTITNTYNGASSSAVGDTYVTFATTLPSYYAHIAGIPYVAATGTPVSGSNSSLSVPVPSGVVAGDLVILALGAEWAFNTATASDASSVSVTGFTVAEVASYQPYANYGETNILLYKYATGADTGNYSVTFNTVGGGSVDASAGVASVVRGGPTSGNPFSDTFQSSYSIGSPSVSVATFTPTAGNTLLFGSVWCNDGVQVANYPSGWTDEVNALSGNGIMIATQQQAVATATGTLTWSMASGSPDPVALIGAIRLNLPPSTITPSSIYLQSGVHFSTELGSDGVPAATFSVASGALPTGLSLSGSTLSGTPTDSGGTGYGFTITATNSLGSTNQTYSGYVDANPLAPLIIAEYAGANQGIPTSQSLTVETGDLIIVTAYVEPANEYTPSSSYDTVTPPTGFTMLPTPIPVNSNDVNIASNTTQRSYIAYRWVTSNGTITVGDWGYGSNWYEFDSIVQMRGATDQNGLQTGVPYQEIAVASYNAEKVTSFPEVSLVTGGANSTLLFIGTSWDSDATATSDLAGWYRLTSLASGVIFVNVESAASNTGSIAPSVASASLLTSVVMSFRKVIVPVAEYSFDEGTGSTIHDSSGNGYDFSLPDTTRWTTSGKTNGGLGYGAGTGYATRVLTADIATASLPFTVMMWVNPANTTQNDSGLVGNTSLDLEYSSGSFYGDGFGTTPLTYPASTWTHVAWVADGTHNTTYINGVSVLSISGSPPSGWQNGATIGIGGSDDTTVFNGVIDDVRLFTTALTAGDITNLMATPVTTSSIVPVISTTLGSMTQFVMFSQAFSGTGTPAPTWSVTSGSLPVGLSLSSGGLLSGTPMVTGSYSFSVTATNSAGSTTQAYSGVVLASRLVRSKTVYQASGTTISATFGESAVLDSTYLLIAILQVNSFTAASVPSGWTEVGNGGVSGSIQTRMFVVQGNGIINGVSIAIDSASATLTVAAYSGFVSLVPIDIDDGNSLSAGTGYSNADLTPGLESGYGVIIQAVGVSDVVTWNSWTTLNRIGATTGDSSLANANQLMTVATLEFDGAIGTPTFGVTWTTSRTGREMGILMPLTNTIPDAVAAYSLDENTGTTAADSSGNNYTATVSHWTTGYTNSGAVGDSSHTAMKRSGTLIAPPTAATIMMWFNPSSGFAGSDVAMVSSNNTSENSNRFGIGFLSSGDGTTPYAWIYNSTANFASAIATQGLSTGTWYHLVTVLDATTISLYINGVLQSSNTWSGSIGAPLAYLEAGGITPYNEYNSGAVDDVRLFDTVLSQWQINQLLNTPVATSVVAATWFLKTSTSLVPLSPYMLMSGGLAALGGGVVMPPQTAPIIVGQSATSTGGYSSFYSPVLTTSASTNAGDLVIIVGYVEPANEGKSSATYGTITTPAGVTLLSGFPIETDASGVTTGDDHRLYAWYYYATINGSETLMFSDDQQVYWALTSISIRGAKTSGDPLSEPASTNVISRTSNPDNTTPSVSLTLGAPNSLVLWLCGDWAGSEPEGVPPSGYTNIISATDQSGQPAVAAKTYTSAGSTGAVVITGHSSTDNGMTAALLSFRAP